MLENNEILGPLYKKRDELTAQLKAINQAIESTHKALGITVPKVIIESIPLPITVIDSYSKESPMDKKIYTILKEIKEGTASDIEEAIRLKEPNYQGDLSKAVTMGVSRLHTIGNLKYISSNNGRIRAKAHPTDVRKKIYYI